MCVCVCMYVCMCKNSVCLKQDSIILEFEAKQTCKMLG